MSEIVFRVEKDPEGGYTARALGEAIFTQGDNEEDVGSIPKIIRLHFVREITDAWDPAGKDTR